MLRFRYLLMVGLLLACHSQASAQRQMERLDRGLVATVKDGSTAFLSWRLLGSDPEEVAFDVYRQVGDEPAAKLTTQPLRSATCFVDREAKFDQRSRYFVQALVSDQPPGDKVS